MRQSAEADAVFQCQSGPFLRLGTDPSSDLLGSIPAYLTKVESSFVLFITAYYFAFAEDASAFQSMGGQMNNPMNEKIDEKA